MRILLSLILIFPLWATDTDEILKRIDPKVSTQFYSMLRDIDSLLTDEQISYWLTCGSLLGAIRHKGMIPWDDDVDLAFFQEDIEHLKNLEPKLEALGYFLLELDGYFKICLKKGKAPLNEENEEYPWKYPFVDLFPMKRYGEKVSYSNERLFNSLGKKEWFLSVDIDEGLHRVPFGKLNVPIPRNSKLFLERVYGEDVWKVAYAQYDHAAERKIEKHKVALVTTQCAPEL